MFGEFDGLGPDGQGKGLEEAFTKNKKIGGAGFQADGTFLFVFSVVAEVVGDIEHPFKPGKIGTEGMEPGKVGVYEGFPLKEDQ